MTQSTQFNLNSVLEKMERSDSDFRYMAASDLLKELKKESFKLDSVQEKKVGAALLKLLIHELSGDVQTQAQLCLGPFVKKISGTQTGVMIEQLLKSLLNAEKDGHRESASYGLKTIINKIPQKSSPLIIEKLVPELTGSLVDSTKSHDVKLEVLDILNVAISQYANLFNNSSIYLPLKDAVLRELESSRKNNRKKATQCLASLAVCMEGQDFNSLVTLLVKTAKSSKNHEVVRGCIQTIGSISRSAGFRLADCMNQVVPIVITCSRGDQSTTPDDETEADDELREYCFQTLESLVSRCPSTISPHLTPIIELCLEYIKYDPNYNDDAMDEEFEVEDGFEDFDETWEEEEVDYSDDEDVSWKVRKAASKTIGEIISTRNELLQYLCDTVAPVLISRFREREETVKLDIFKTFNRLLKQVRQSNSIVKTGSLTSIENKVPTIIAALAKILGEKKELKIKVRIGIFTLLKELVQCTNFAVGEKIESLISGITASLTDKNATSNLKIETLTFLRLLFSEQDTNNLTVTQKSIISLAEPIFLCVSDNYYKITSEALRVCTALLPLLTTTENGSIREYKSLVDKLYEVLLPKLEAQDIDQEVKEAAINCAALLISRVGNEISDELPSCYKILQDRLANEITRLTAVKALALISQSPLKLDLSSILSASINHITTFLRLNNRQLKQSSLTTLNVLFETQNVELISDSIRSVLENVAPIISDEDLPLTHLALQLTSTVLTRFPSAAKIIKEKIFGNISSLLASKVLQGLALDSLLILLKEIVKTRTKGFGFTHLSKVIGGILNNDQSKQCIPAAAQCIGVLAANTSEKKRNGTIVSYIEQIKSPAVSVHQRVVALHCIGEIGRRINLENHSGIENTITDAFDEPIDEIKIAASFALGNLAVGNLAKYLSVIFSNIPLYPDRQYLLMLSLREVISRQSKTTKGISELFVHLTNQELDLLLQQCQVPKDGVRNAVAECLGRLALVKTEEMLNKLEEKLDSSSPYDRSTAVAAIKFAVVDNKKQQELDQFIKPKLPAFLNLLSDPDLNVRKNALLTFNYLVHNRPTLVIDILPDYLGKVYEESIIKENLLSKVKVGPFTYVHDEGLDNRKAAFECMYTLLENCLPYINISDFITHLVRGLEDSSPDIKSMCHIMLEHLAKSSGGSLVQMLDSVVEPLRSTLTTKPKDSAVKQDKERYEELVRSTLRAVLAISKIPNVDSSTKFTEFLATTVTAGEMAEKYLALQESQQNDNMETV